MTNIYFCKNLDTNEEFSFMSAAVLDISRPLPEPDGTTTVIYDAIFDRVPVAEVKVDYEVLRGASA